MIVFKFDWVRSTGSPLWLPLHLFLSLHTQVPAVCPLFPLPWWEGLVTAPFRLHRHLPWLGISSCSSSGWDHWNSTPNPCFVYISVHVSWPEISLKLNLGSCPDADLVSFPRPTMAQFWRKVSYRWLLSALWDISGLRDHRGLATLRG